MDAIPPDLISDVESSHTTGRMTGRSSVEILVRADRRRSWSVEQKREIVAESLGPELTAAEVVRKHGITTGQLYTWRRQMVSLQTDVGARHSPRFAAVEVSMSSPSASPAPMAASAFPPRVEGLIEVVLPGGVLIRVDADVDARALRRVLGALSER